MMEEFTPITTQEQFDAAIGARLARERETLGKRYADYDDLKQKAADYEKQLSKLQRTMQEDAQKYAGYDKTLSELQAKVKGYETDSVKTRIALEMGLPYAMSARLTGDTEDAIRKDAEDLRQMMRADKPQSAPPLRSHEPATGSSEREALRTLSAQLETNE